LGVIVHNADRTLRSCTHVDDFAAVTKALLLGYVQVPAEMETGSNGARRIQKASLSTVAAAGCKVGQSDRARVREQDVDRTSGCDLIGEPGHVLIGHIVGQPV
jgi:hypothetical protein